MWRKGSCPQSTPLLSSTRNRGQGSVNRGDVCRPLWMHTHLISVFMCMNFLVYWLRIHTHTYLSVFCLSVQKCVQGSSPSRTGMWFSRGCGQLESILPQGWSLSRERPGMRVVWICSHYIVHLRHTPVYLLLHLYKEPTPKVYFNLIFRVCLCVLASADREWRGCPCRYILHGSSVGAAGGNNPQPGGFIQWHHQQIHQRPRSQDYHASDDQQCEYISSQQVKPEISRWVQIYRAFAGCIPLLTAYSFEGGLQ